MEYIYIKEMPFPQYVIKGNKIDETIVGDYVVIQVPDHIDAATLESSHFDTNYNFLIDEYIKTKKGAYRSWRAECFYAFDILKTNLIIGLESMLSEVEKQWYFDILSFTDTIDENTLISDYPQIPLRVEKHTGFYDY